jgi:cytochrome b pre-mRNA-processing protein 3
MVMAAIRSWFADAPQKREAQEAYIALVHQSRNPFFYRECAVPDTLDGRFDIITLHAFLALQRIKADKSRSRLLLEALFDDMDRSLREMGVGDMGVGKRVKKMAGAVFGRLETYEKAQGNGAELKEALRRNIYRGADIPVNSLNALCNYVTDQLNTGGINV